MIAMFYYLAAVWVMIGILAALFIIPLRSRFYMKRYLGSEEFYMVLDPILDRYHDKIIPEIKEEIICGVGLLFKPKIDTMGREIPSDLINDVVRAIMRTVASHQVAVQRQLDSQEYEGLSDEEKDYAQLNEVVDGLMEDVLGVKLPVGLKMKLFSKLMGPAEKIGTAPSPENRGGWSPWNMIKR